MMPYILPSPLEAARSSGIASFDDFSNSNRVLCASGRKLATLLFALLFTVADGDHARLQVALMYRLKVWKRACFL